MRVVLALRRNYRTGYIALLLELFKRIVVLVPRREAVVVNHIRFLKLSPEVSGIHIAGKVGRAGLNPGVFVNLTAQEAASVSALLADNLGKLNVFFILDKESAALAHAVVFSLVEGVAAVVADCAESLALVLAHYALSRVLANLEVVSFRDVHNSVHLAAYACIVNGNNRLCLIGNRLLNELFVDVHCVGADIYKFNLCSAQNKSVGGGNKGK